MVNHCQQRIAELSEIIPQISVHTAYEKQQQGALIIDVRTEAEYAQCHITDALYVGRDYVEMRIETQIPDYHQPIVVTCGGGTRSLFVAESLRKLGYQQIYNMSGGFRAWHSEALPTT